MELKNNKTYTAIKLFIALTFILNIALCISIFLFSYIDGYNILSLPIILISFIPTLLLYLISRKTKHNKKSLKIWSILISIILFLVLIFYDFIGFVLFIFIQEIASIEPTKYRYSNYFSKMTEKTYRIKHFPTRIPKNAKNYYFLIERGGQGYWIHYLKFKTDESYIKETLNKNNDNIYKKIEFSQVNSYYKFIDNYFDIKDRNNAFVYILKNKNNDYNYTSGIITSKLNEIVFFYANFNIKQDGH